MGIEPQAAMEMARFLGNGPTPEQIIAFHPSKEATERAYELLSRERAGTLTDDERGELDSCVFFEQMMRLVKTQARLALQQRAS